MTFLELLVCAVLVSVAGFMSAAEVSLFSLSRFQLRSIKDRFRSAHRKIKRLLGDPGGLLITVLVVNEVTNIALSTVITEAVARSWETGWPRVHAFHLRFFPNVPSWAFQTFLGIAVTAPIVLFLCEMTPKVLAARANTLIAPISVGGLSWIYDALKPVRLALKRFMTGVSRLLGSVPEKHDEDNRQMLREDEFLIMVEEANREGSIDPSELGLIRRVFEMDETRVSEIYTPLAHVHTLSVNTTVKGAIAAMRAGQRYSRIPVTAGPSKKQVVGVLYTKDLLLAKLEAEAGAYSTVSTLMRKPFTVPPSARLTGLFRKFKQHKTHMAVVEAAPGEAVGIVTMADVLGALFEDLLEEDEDEPVVPPVGPPR